MLKSPINRLSEKTAAEIRRIARPQMRYFSKHTKRNIVLLIVLLSSAWAIRAIASEYTRRTQVLSEQILAKAGQLRELTYGSALNSPQIEETLGELKGLIEEYEENLLFAQSPYPGEILLGTTPGGQSMWLETLCDGRYDGPMKEIRIRRSGRWGGYLRINDIEVTYSTPRGLVQETFNENGRVKLYPGGVLKLALARPMRIRRIRINISHSSSGLEVYGVPYERVIPQIFHPISPRSEEDLCPAEILLGTTPPGDSTWLETLCDSHCGRPIKEIRLRRTGRQASYLRINDIEITYMTARGPKKQVFNEGGRAKLYYGGEFRLALSQPMRVTRIRININHESTGLEVYGVH